MSQNEDKVAGPRVTRGALLKSGVAVGLASVSGCTEIVRRVVPPPVPASVPASDANPRLLRLLNRAGFGPRPGDLEAAREMGPDGWLEEQLEPRNVDEGWEVSLRLGSLDTLDLDAQDARDFEMSNYPEVGQGQAAVELQQAALIRAVYSRRQLHEAMVHFWSDHFNISQRKSDCTWLKTVDDRLLRPHVLGKFRDLVAASAKSPAMLYYLDNAKNRKRDPDTGSGPNENYARELLELHTLGVHGGYSLKDIQEVARCLTGWSYHDGLHWQAGRFNFEADRHEAGSKRVLGKLIPAGGLDEGEEVLDIVCNHPSTARYVAWKLVRRFVSDRGSPALERRLAAVFTRTGGDLRAVTGELFRSEEFGDPRNRKLKRPFDFVAGALRATAANTDCRSSLRWLEDLGQLPFKWPMPDGYPERAAPWLSGLLPRWNFALSLVQGEIAGATVPLQELERGLRWDSSSPHARAAATARLLIGVAHPDLTSSLALGPCIRPNGLREALCLTLASPQFQGR